ncbi:hypothetical protein ACFWN2_13325 [Lentzea sp. NPDC058436]|uniref:hypothetical protein n=1 Tax=Lentzea sp. NPDC058436 TaxID=3346499 RepID=UPI00365DE19D
MTRLSTAVAALVMLGLAGCGTQPAATPPASTTPPTSATSESAGADIPPRPDAPTTKAYLDDLRAIDPAIVDEKNTDRAVVIGRFHCASVKSFPTDQVKLIDLTNKRFTEPGHGAGFGEEKAEKILAVVREHICPTY